jgi:hypothetical protein
MDGINSTFYYEIAIIIRILFLQALYYLIQLLPSFIIDDYYQNT